MALDINQLYQSYLGRAPDASGFDYWNSLLNSGMSEQEVKNAFFAAAADEVQKNDAGLSPDTDAWDEARIVDGMKLYDANPALGGSYYANAGDTRTTSAADRLGGFSINQYTANPSGYAASLQAQKPVEQPQFKPQETKFDNPFAYNQKNPYLSQMADTIKSQVNDNLTRNVMPQIASGAQLVGGFGGSRQGVVEANALKDANNSLSNALTGMYYGDYNNAMNLQLQKYGLDQSYNLGLGNLQLGNRNTDLAQVQLGANLFQQGNTGMLGQGQGVYNLGLTTQQAPWQAMGNFSGVSQPYTGFGTTTGSTNGSSGAGFLGGAIGASQIYNLWQK